LRSAGVDAQEIHWIANCHLHFDHCGGNPHLPGRPIFVQAVELERARTVENYTLPEVIDFPNARYEQVDGESEILPDVFLIPTPGHTEGHQVLAVRQPDGTIILAGQAFNTAFDFGSDYLAWRAQRQDGFADDSIAIMPWMDRLIALDPRRILFAHDFSVWEPAGRPAEDASAANG
jgi:glyoxylase-like metal-dependent hydrolase (beta-lactamase superfamily II)